MKTTIMKSRGDFWALVLIACYVVFSRIFITTTEISKFVDIAAIFFLLAYFAFVFVRKNKRPVNEMTGNLLSKEVHEKTKKLVRGEARKKIFYQKHLSTLANLSKLCKDKASGEVENYKRQADIKAREAQDILLMCSKMSISRY